LFSSIFLCASGALIFPPQNQYVHERTEVNYFSAIIFAPI